MTRRIVDKPYTIDLAGNIKYPEPPKAPEVETQEEFHTDTSIDTLLLRGLSTIDWIMKSCREGAGTIGWPSRESVQNLKDCMMMLKDLKIQESELLDKMDDEQIEEYLRNKKNEL